MTSIVSSYTLSWSATVENWTHFLFEIKIKQTNLMDIDLGVESEPVEILYLTLT